MNASSTDIQIVIFRVAGEQFALPTGTAREVVRYEQPRRLPGSEPWVRGVINLRGEIIPVIDLLAALGLEGGSSPAKTVICDVDSGSVGLLVDDVTAVRSIVSADITQHARRGHPALTGVIQFDDELVVLLDLAQLLRAGGQASSMTGHDLEEAA